MASIKLYAKLLVLVFLCINIANFAQAQPVNYQNDSTCQSGIYTNINISTAYYGDLDNDTYHDDIFVRVKVDLFCKQRYNFDYYAYLILPSGTQTYDAIGINTRLTSLTFETTFLNWAIESGDYQVVIKILMYSGGPQVSSTDYIFDPPGGSTGTGSGSTKVL